MTRLLSATTLSALALPLALVACTKSSTGPTSEPDTWGTPISGGSMIVSNDGKRAIIADTDRDRIVIVQLDNGTIVANTQLNENDQPGRMVEDANGNVYVGLRRGGALLQFDGTTGAQKARVNVCAEPRGVAWESATNLVHVACATGELVSFDASKAELPQTRNVKLERDLRDIVVPTSSATVPAGTLIISKLRSAEMLTVDATGKIISRSVSPTVQRIGSTGAIGSDPNSGAGAPQGNGLVPAVPAVAWKTFILRDNNWGQDGIVVQTHQRQVQGTLSTTTEDGYGGGTCNSQGPVEAAMTTMVPGEAPNSVRVVTGGALPVDMAANGNGLAAVITAGNQNITVFPTYLLGEHDDDDPCGGGGGMGGGGDTGSGGGLPPDGGGSGSGMTGGGGGAGSGSGGGQGDDNDNQNRSGQVHDNLGAPTAVAWAHNSLDQLVVFYPEVPAIVVRDHGLDNAHVIKLPGDLGYDAGRNVFHQQTKSGLACASCHPEGRDDGLIWTFAEFGTRRSQNLSGGIMARAPYHWTGDKPDLNNLMDDVFAVRMGGGKPTAGEKLAIGPFLDRLPAPAPEAGLDQAAVARGKAIFESTETKCTTCHVDSMLTNNTLNDVGTQGVFKTPSLLGVGARGPWMHNGCAQTLRDRFNPTCGGGDKHGKTSQLSSAQIDDLTAYLESL